MDIDRLLAIPRAGTQKECLRDALNDLRGDISAWENINLFWYIRGLSTVCSRIARGVLGRSRLAKEESARRVYKFQLELQKGVIQHEQTTRQRIQ